MGVTFLSSWRASKELWYILLSNDALALINEVHA